MAVAHESDHGSPTGQVDGPELGADHGRVLVEGHFHETGVAALELQQADEHADRDGLLHEAGEQLRRRDGDVHAPHLVEQPVVLRVVHPGEHPGNGELLLGELGDDEVVLVVAGRGDDDVHLVEMRRLQRRHLAGVRGHIRDAIDRRQGGHEVRVRVEQLHLMAVLGQVLGEETADLARPCDRDLHDWASAYLGPGTSETPGNRAWTFSSTA